MKNKRGQAVAWVFVAVIVLALIGGGIYYFTKAPSQAVIQQTAQEVAEATKTGDVASIGVYVRDISNNDVNTKIAVATYCQDSKGGFIIDGTSSSTSAEITGKTTIGEDIECWAFNSTYQTLNSVTFKVESEVEHIVIDSYQVPTQANVDIDYYDDTLTVADAGISNLSVASEGSDSFSKLRLKNNVSDTILPLGGLYLDVIEDSNITAIEMAGSATLSGFSDTIANDAHSSTNIVDSTLSTAVSARKSRWDYVFELDDDSSQSGNQVLLLEENDYLETGSITVSSDVGCSAGSTGSRIINYVFTKGYFRETKNSGVAYGHETDATTATVISTDLTGPTVYCG